MELSELGANAALLKEAQGYPDLQLARVCVQHRGQYRVATDLGEYAAGVSGALLYEAGDRRGFPVVGDWVMVGGAQEHERVIHHILERSSLLTRQAAGESGEVQPIAANIDTVFICMGCDNDFNLRRLERYLAAVWESGAMPVVVLTKADLAENMAELVCSAQESAIGAEVIAVSKGEGYEGLLPFVNKGRTVAFIGSSGVGKSTMINGLLGFDGIVTGEVRKDGKGRHTTTHRQLFVLESGGIVIDTPGMRELQLAGADIDRAFDEIAELSERCRFSDCKHGNEPGCAVREAIELHKLSEERLESYRKLLREQGYEGLNSREREREKINSMFGSMGAMKTVMDEVRRKNRR